MSQRAALSHDRRPLSLRHALIVAALLILGFLASGPLRQLYGQQVILERLAGSAATVDGRNDDLRADIDRLGDPAYLEQQARECLGMVRPGEQPVVRAGEPSDC